MFPKLGDERRDLTGGQVFADPAINQSLSELPARLTTYLGVRREVRDIDYPLSGFQREFSIWGKAPLVRNQVAKYSIVIAYVFEREVGAIFEAIVDVGRNQTVLKVLETYDQFLVVRVGTFLEV